MDQNLMKLLMQRHSYEEWRGTNNMKENLFIWKFFLAGDELPEWEPLRIQPMEHPVQQLCIQSMWKLKDGNENTLLRLDIYECSSRQDAHKFLLQLLGEFQSPEVERRKDIKLGDVVFMGKQDTMLLFARANLVVMLRNAGRQLIGMKETSSIIDKELCTEPDIDIKKVAPEIRRFHLPEKELQVGVSSPLEIEAAEPLDRPILYKFYSNNGEVLLSEKRLVYRPDVAGMNQIRVSAINSNRGVAVSTLNINVK